jgi:hypothetical protein
MVGPDLYRAGSFGRERISAGFAGTLFPSAAAPLGCALKSSFGGWLLHERGAAPRIM